MDEATKKDMMEFTTALMGMVDQEVTILEVMMMPVANGSIRYKVLEDHIYFDAKAIEEVELDVERLKNIDTGKHKKEEKELISENEVLKKHAISTTESVGQDTSLVEEVEKQDIRLIDISFIYAMVSTNVIQLRKKDDGTLYMIFTEAGLLMMASAANGLPRKK